MNEKNIYTMEQCSWIDYLEINPDTLERKLKDNTPTEIIEEYVKHHIYDANLYYRLSNVIKNRNEKLKREKLIELKSQINNTLNDINESCLLCLIKMELLLNEYDFESNDDFYSINKINDVHWLDSMDAMNYLFDYVEGKMIIHPHEILTGDNLTQINMKQDNYYKTNIVCLEEKENLLVMIKKIREYIIGKLGPISK